ncbi:UNVERIFIED_CONTAM: hypothetical protein Slati_3131900 [Sesamum latifolium]|uniref:CAAX prenyl protease 2/Lysostaphin resistance protein A-like domain-containing protein n=1 Tax=Sesamum latifolium TaxID=2727402 RepID=A0AAW2UUH2_9LAMI
MAVTLYTSFTRSSISTVRLSPKLYSPVKTHFRVSPGLRFSPLTPALKLRITSTRGFCTVRCYKDNTPQESSKKDSGLNWRILKRWDVPWNWQTISLTSLACGLSFVLTGLIEAVALQYSGLNIEELSLDEKAEILLADQGIATIVVLAVLYSLTKSFSPLPDDIYRYDWREPFNLEKGWLLWAGIGLGGALAAIAVTGAAMSFLNGEPSQRETDALVRLLPLIGSSSISTASLLGITGILAPVLEETVFRGFFMVSLTKWLPTPLSVLVSASVFAAAHLTPGEFPQLFVLGTALGFSYSQTRNLLTPIMIHAFWNSGVIVLLTFLQDGSTLALSYSRIFSSVKYFFNLFRSKNVNCGCSCVAPRIRYQGIVASILIHMGRSLSELGSVLTKSPYLHRFLPLGEFLFESRPAENPFSFVQMAATLYTSFTGSSISTVRLPPKLYSPVKTHVQVSRGLRFSPKAPALKLRRTSTSGFCTVCCYKNNTPQESSKKDSVFNRRILKRWDVPWHWQTISLTSLACRLSITTIVVLAVLYSLTKSSSPLPDDIYRYDWREPFNLEKGWLLWAGIGLGGALAAEAVIGAAMSLFNAGPPHTETDALVQLLPLIGGSSVCTASLGMIGILAPVLEETVF